MTVIPFTPHAARPQPGTRPPLPAEAVVTGSFQSPSGRTGTFEGTYRLERFVSQFCQLAAAGVFTGELLDAGGGHIGFGSRRHTGAVEVVAGPTTLLAHLGPVDVNVLGFLVTMPELTVHVEQATAEIAEALRVIGPPPDRDGLPASVTELISKVVSASGTVPGTARADVRRGPAPGE